MITLPTTPDSIAWPLVLDLYYAMSPAAWARRVFEPDPWQDAILDDRGTRIHANTSRQIGKSTTVAAKVTHRAWYRHGQLILLIAPTLRQSVELIRKVKWFLREAGCPKSSYKAGSLTIEILHTESRIIALPGGNPDNIRGYSGPDMIVIDEASFAKDQLYHSLRPMMLSKPQGQIILISTPFTKRGFFYDISSRTNEDLGEAWSRYVVPARDCPRVQQSFLNVELKAMGPWWFNSEYGCKFQDPLDGLFTREMVDASTMRGLQPLYDTDAVPEAIIDSWGLAPLYQ